MMSRVEDGCGLLLGGLLLIWTRVAEEKVAPQALSYRKDECTQFVAGSWVSRG